MSISDCACRIRTAIAASVLAVVCLDAGAAGRGEVIPESFTFRYDRGELRSATGAAKVYLRLTREARRACRAVGPGPQIGRATMRRECEAALIDKVVSASGVATLAGRHADTSHFRLARELGVEPEGEVRRIALRAGN